MAKKLARRVREVLKDARRRLGMTQPEFGTALGWSGRTAQRWETGQAEPTEDSLVKLAGLLAPVDPELAAEAAAAAHATLESLDLVPRPVASAAPTPTPIRPVPADALSDAVLCAVADATDLPSRALRPIVYAAFQRARALGLTVEQVEESFRERLEAKPASATRMPARLRVRIASDERDELDQLVGPSTRDDEPSPALPPRRTRVR